MRLRQLFQPLRRKHAVTLIELLTALAVSMILVGAMAAAFIQVIRASDEAEAQVRGANSSRLAVDTIAREVAQLQLTGLPEPVVVLIDRPLTYGDGINQDGDTAFDEELFDGFDDDGDWVLADHDRHAPLPDGAGVERQEFVSVPDFGDLRVDQDVRFSADELTFIMPGILTSTGNPQQITYSLGTFEGEEHVLLKTIVDDVQGTSPSLTVEPIVFDVVSLDILAWDSNITAVGPTRFAGYWTSEWNSTNLPINTRPMGSPVGVPPFKFPTSFLISVVTNAERLPLAELTSFPGGGTLKAARATTIVNVHSTITDPRYRRFVRRP